MSVAQSLLPYPSLAAAVNRDVSPWLLAGGAAAITYAGACLALYSIQTKLIYRPLPQIIKTPADLGLAYEDIWIPVQQDRPYENPKNQLTANEAEGGHLHAWWVPNPSSHRVMLFCHGNYGNISYNTERIRFHHAQGCSVLAFDYRGYGQSSGPVPNEQNIFADAETALNHLIEKRKISPKSITVAGHSIGGAVAIDLASRHPEVDRLIVESSFTTMQDAVEAKTIYRFFPIEALLTEPFDSLSKVSDLRMPVLYVHGDHDFDVPAKFSHQLYAFTPEPKQLFIAPGADHNMNTLAGDRYAAVLQDFYNLSYAAESIAQLQLA
ncbi:MAG: alpha/beta hydrolase [Cyanobacteria bacterium P01_D01_bin.1]